MNSKFLTNVLWKQNLLFVSGLVFVRKRGKCHSSLGERIGFPWSAYLVDDSCGLLFAHKVYLNVCITFMYADMYMYRIHIFILQDCIICRLMYL